MASRIRSYNAFLRSAKSQSGLTHRQAQGLYRALRDRLGSTPTRLDLRRHPRVTDQEVRRVLGKPSIPKERKKPIRSLDEYDDFYSDIDFDTEEVAAGVDYGEE